MLRDGQLLRPGVTTLTLTPKSITDQDPVKYVPKCEVVKLSIATVNLFFLVVAQVIYEASADHSPGHAVRFLHGQAR